MKPKDFIQTLNDPALPPLSGHDEGGHLLLVVIAHVFFADDHLAESEIAQFARLSGSDDPKSDAEALRSEPMNVPRIAELFPDAQDRDDIITLLEHAMWGDDHPDLGEWDIVDKLVEGLGVQRD